MKACYFLLTPGCNMRCKYCFQHDTVRKDVSSVPGVVADEKTIDMFALFCRKNNIDCVEFFGGEPLLFKDRFLYAVDVISKAVLNIQLGVVTNGTLIDEEIMDLLERRKISVLLSLDGKRARHDFMRGNFDRIAPWFGRLAAKGHTTVAMQVGVVKDIFQHIRYVWKTGLRRVYLNVIQNYGWYNKADPDDFEKEYESAVKAMLDGKGELVCALSMYQTLRPATASPECGITLKGLACDWQGLIYPCHRIWELGAHFAIGDLRKGILKKKDSAVRSRINRQCFKSAHARRYPLVSFCPVDVYQKHGDFSGRWNRLFCEMINRKAKIVAKYYFEIEKYCARHDSGGPDKKPQNTTFDCP